MYARMLDIQTISYPEYSLAGRQNGAVFDAMNGCARAAARELLKANRTADGYLRDTFTSAATTYAEAYEILGNHADNRTHPALPEETSEPAVTES